jgi:hypothetical protein
MAVPPGFLAKHDTDDRGGHLRLTLGVGEGLAEHGMVGLEQHFELRIGRAAEGDARDEAEGCGEGGGAEGAAGKGAGMGGSFVGAAVILG